MSLGLRSHSRSAAGSDLRECLYRHLADPKAKRGAETTRGLSQGKNRFSEIRRAGASISNLPATILGHDLGVPHLANCLSRRHRVAVVLLPNLSQTYPKPIPILSQSCPILPLLHPVSSEPIQVVHCQAISGCTETSLCVSVPLVLYLVSVSFESKNDYVPMRGAHRANTDSDNSNPDHNN